MEKRDKKIIYIPDDAWLLGFPLLPIALLSMGLIGSCSDINTNSEEAKSQNNKDFSYSSKDVSDAHTAYMNTNELYSRELLSLFHSKDDKYRVAIKAQGEYYYFLSEDKMYCVTGIENGEVILKAIDDEIMGNFESIDDYINPNYPAYFAEELIQLEQNINSKKVKRLK